MLSPFFHALPTAYGEPAVTREAITGELEVLQVDDFTNPRDNRVYFLKDRQSQRRFRLRFAKHPPLSLQSGTFVTAQGRTVGQDLFLEADGLGGDGLTVLAPVTTVVAGDQKTLVMVADLADAAVSCSPTAIHDMLFGNFTATSVNDFYLENSFGNVSVSGEVVGPYRLNDKSTGTCAYNTWADELDAKAKAQGVNVDAYTRKVYVLPKEAPCDWAGLGSLGGLPSRAWLLHCDVPDTFAHELGHNLGMHHASTPTSEYGDSSDVMGAGGIGLRHTNAPHKEQMGWLPFGQVQTLTQSGIYQLAPLEVDPSSALAPQSLKVWKPDTNEYYYLSYRRPVGFDAENLYLKYRDKLSIHRSFGSRGAKTYLLGILGSGQSFTDDVSGVTISPLSQTSELMTVQVDFHSTCTPQSPTVTLTPSSQSGAPGDARVYTMTVTNRDSGCSQSTFALQSTVPTGWISAFSSSALTLASGTSGQATLTLTSPLTAAAQNYAITIIVSDNLQTLHSGSATATYVVTIDTQPPTTPTGVSITNRRKYLSLAWNASTDNVGVKLYNIHRDGTLLGSTTMTSYIDATVRRGDSYTYTVVAVDAAGNLSAPSVPVSATFDSSSGGGSGSGGTGKGNGKKN
ncbi:MAG: hypothetical protein AB7P18_07930 [Candidatus Binatia bacterium]